MSASRTPDEIREAAELLRAETGYQPMTRFGGKPYHDGHTFRCPDCNGLVVWVGRHWPVQHREAICRTCGHSARLNAFSNHVRLPAGTRRTV